MRHERLAVGCFLPPHILRRIAEHGEPLERERAYAAMEAAAEARGQRVFAGGEVLRARATAGHRRVFDAERKRRLPGRLVRENGGPKSGDAAADEAYDGAGVTCAFLRDILGRDSIDGKGMRLESTVHYGVGYANAMWNGRQMIYGDGDGRLFRRFTVSLDVIAHELMHGVTQHVVGLDYAGEAGALSEHLSDVFGALVRQYSEKKTAAKADWLIGAAILTRRVHGDAIRSMKAPGTAYDDPILARDPQPSHMRDFVRTEFDNGGVHINSGIPNHAFYRAAIAIGGNAWEVAGKIWYRAIGAFVRHDASFGVRCCDPFRGGGNVRARQRRAAGDCRRMERRRDRHRSREEGEASSHRRRCDRRVIRLERSLLSGSGPLVPGSPGPSVMDPRVPALSVGA